MPTSVRLDKKTEFLLEETAKITKVSKAEIIKLSIQQYCPPVLEEKKRHPFELIKDLVDKTVSGRGDLSVKGEEILRTLKYTGQSTESGFY